MINTTQIIVNPPYNYAKLIYGFFYFVGPPACIAAGIILIIIMIYTGKLMLDTRTPGESVKELFADIRSDDTLKFLFTAFCATLFLSLAMCVASKIYTGFCL